MKVYIAGKITGDSAYKEKFQRAASAIEAQGDIVITKMCPKWTKEAYDG